MAEQSTAPAKDLFGFFDEYLVQKAPFQIPDGGKEWIAQYGPWISIALLVLALPGLLFLFGIGTVLMPFGGIGYATGFGLSSLLMIAQLGMMIAALPGLFARKKSAWTLMVYAQLIGFVGSLLVGQVIGAIIGAVIGLYILFQIRVKYVN